MVGSEKILCLAAQLEQPLRCIHYDAKQAQVSKRLLPEVVSCGSPNQLLLKFGNHFHVYKICAAAGRRVVQSGYVVVHWCSRPLPFSNISNSCL